MAIIEIKKLMFANEIIKKVRLVEVYIYLINENLNIGLNYK